MIPSLRFTLAALFLSASSGNAEIIAYEPFTTANSGTGWAGNWNASDATKFNINAGSLSYSCVTSTGNKILFGTLNNNDSSSSSAIRNLAATIDLTTLGTLYISFLAHTPDAGEWNGKAVNLAPQKPDGSSMFQAGGVWSGGGYADKYGIAKPYQDGVISSMTQTVGQNFHLLRLTRSGEVTTADYWVNPNLSSLGTPILSQTDNGWTEISAIRIEGSSNVRFDEIRVATTLEDAVTAVPEPSVTFALISGGLAFALRRRRCSHSA